MTIDATPAIVVETVARLRAAGCVFAEDEADLMLEQAATEADLEDMVRRRIDGLPLEHILGWARFVGRRYEVDPGVFVPRHRSEFLVLSAVAAVDRTTSPVVVDLCCGAGALGAALLERVETADLYSADIDPDAVRSARRNVTADRVYEGDLFDALPVDLRGRIDVLICNAPYVPSEAIALMPPEARVHEARIALDGGDDGLDVQRRVAAEALSWLAPGGRLLVESSERQEAIAVEAFRAAGLTAWSESSEDFDATIVIGERPANP